MNETRPRIVSFVALLALAGCSGGQEPTGPAPANLVPASGKVTLDGEPVAGAEVHLVPEEGTPGPGSIGMTDEEGGFDAITGNEDGAMPGRYKVYIVKPSNPDAAQVEPGSPSLLPERYASPETSGLSVTVPEDGGELDPFELTGG